MGATVSGSPVGAIVDPPVGAREGVLVGAIEGVSPGAAVRGQQLQSLLFLADAAFRHVGKMSLYQEVPLNFMLQFPSRSAERFIVPDSIMSIVGVRMGDMLLLL